MCSNLKAVDGANAESVKNKWMNEKLIALQKENNSAETVTVSTKVYFPIII